MRWSFLRVYIYSATTTLSLVPLFVVGCTMIDLNSPVPVVEIPSSGSAAATPMARSFVIFALSLAHFFLETQLNVKLLIVPAVVNTARRSLLLCWRSFTLRPRLLVFFFLFYFGCSVLVFSGNPGV